MLILTLNLFSQTATEIKDYVFNYCTKNENVDESEIAEILNDIIDEEFDTICEDNSVNGKNKIQNRHFCY